MKKGFNEDAFRSRLEESEFPLDYLYKFIVPSEQLGVLHKTLPQGLKSERPSKNGKYVSVSLRTKAKSADEIIAVYKSLSAIEGIISL